MANPPTTLLLCRHGLSQWNVERRVQGTSLHAAGLAALVPLTTVLAGFWLLVPAARGSLVFAGALFGSGVALVATLLAGWWINRQR